MKIEVKIYDKEDKSYSEPVDLEEFILHPDEIEFKWKNGDALPYNDFIFFGEDYCYSVFVNGEHVDLKDSDKE